MNARPVGRAADTAKDTAHRAQRSPWVKRGARAGYVMLGVVHLVLAWIVVRLGIGDSSSDEASQDGALSQIADQPLGAAVLGFTAIAFLALAGWQVMTAVTASEWKDRITSGAKTAVYLVLAFMAGRFALGMGAGDTDEEGMTATVMSYPAGRVAIAAVGIGIIAVGIGHMYSGWTKKFADGVDTGSSREMSTAVITTGRIGYTAKGIALAVLGGLFASAALTADPEEAGGLDQAFAEIGSQPFGSVLLILVGVGLGCFGLFAIARARGERM